MPRRGVRGQRWDDGQRQRLGRAAESRRHVIALKRRVTVAVLDARNDRRVASLKLGVDVNREASKTSAARSDERVAVRSSAGHIVSTRQ